MNYFSLFKDYFQYRLKAKDEYFIHSPYMFDFFTKGLKAKMSNKTFKELKLRTKAMRSDLSCLQLCLRHRNNLFLSRLSAYFAPKRVLVISDCEDDASFYLSKILPQTEIVFLDKIDNLNEYDSDAVFDFIYLNLEKTTFEAKLIIDKTLLYCSSNALIIFGNAVGNSCLKEQWLLLQEDERFKVTADFFLCKVIFLTQNPIKKQHYCLLTK